MLAGIIRQPCAPRFAGGGALLAASTSRSRWLARTPAACWFRRLAIWYVYMPTLKCLFIAGMPISQSVEVKWYYWYLYLHLICHTRFLRDGTACFIAAASWFLPPTRGAFIQWSYLNRQASLKMLTWRQDFDWWWAAAYSFKTPYPIMPSGLNSSVTIILLR